MPGRDLEVQARQFVADGQTGRGPSQPGRLVDFGAVTEAPQGPVVEFDQRPISAALIERFEQLSLDLAAEAAHLTQHFQGTAPGDPPAVSAW